MGLSSMEAPASKKVWNIKKKNTHFKVPRLRRGLPAANYHIKYYHHKVEISIFSIISDITEKSSRTRSDFRVLLRTFIPHLKVNTFRSRGMPSFEISVSPPRRL